MTITIPSAPAELEEMLSDPTKMKDVFADKDSFKNFVKNYAKAVNDKDNSIAAQVREETQRILAEFVKDGKTVNKLDLRPDNDKGIVNKYHKLENPRAVGTPLNGVYDNVGTFALDVWNNSHPHGRLSTEGAERIGKVQNYQETVPSEGGFLVPEEFRAELLRLSLDSAIVRPRARVVPMGSKTLTFPMVDSTSNVSSVFGGIVVYRTEEGAELVESQSSFGAIKLDASKQTALAHVTNELLRDAAGGFQMYLEEIFPEAIAYYEDLDFLTGTGAGEPLGALSNNNSALISVAKETGQAAATVVWENIIKMYARMLPSSLARAVWIASPETFVELATMALSVGTGGSAVWLTNGTEAPTLTLLGRPVILSEKAPAVLGTQGDLSFVDFGMYLIGDRQQMTMDSSPHVKFTSDKTTFRVIQRNDGRPWLQSAITPHNNSPSLSPFVQLATRS